MPPPRSREAEAALEVANGLRQYDLGLEIIHYFLEPGRPFALRPSLVRQLQQAACEGLQADAGQFRSRPVRISGSAHTPPEPHLVPPLVQEMCDYVNDHRHERTPFHLAAYVMWRLNWIHPFSDGNGRTSRVLSYIVLCTSLGYLLPGSPTIPQQIEADRSLYIKALDEADEAARSGEIDLSAMEGMLKGMLANQLLSVIHAASGEESAS